MILKSETELLLLAAGRGSRMGALTENLPKSLIPINGKPIVEHTVDGYYQVFKNQAVSIVSGYNKDALNRWVSSRGELIKTYENKKWDQCGPTVSLKVGLEKDFDVDVLMIGNGDTVFTKELFNIVSNIGSKEGYYLIVSKIFDFDQDSMLVDEQDGNLVRAGKRIQIEPKPEWESAGLLVVSGREKIEFIRSKVNRVVHGIEKKVQSDGPWHEVVNVLRKDGVEIKVVEVPYDSWWECDTHRCIVNAEQGITE